MSTGKMDETVEKVDEIEEINELKRQKDSRRVNSGAVEKCSIFGYL